MDRDELLDLAAALGACDPGLSWGARLPPDAGLPAAFDRDTAMAVAKWFIHHGGYFYVGWCVGRLIRVGDLSGADLRDFKLCSARMPRADLRGANLPNASLRFADLRGANLRDADLSGATLLGADLRGADLRGADLRGADLRGAALNEAIMPKGWQDAVKAY